MGKTLARFLADRSGVTGIEYCVIACFISLVLVAAARTAGLHVGMTLGHVVAFMLKGHASAP